MEIIDLIAEGEKWPRPSGARAPNLGEWMGHPPAGRHVQDVDEIYIFRVTDGKLTGATAVEDNLARMRQLGLNK
jgi:predicted ester cyclase